VCRDAERPRVPASVPRQWHSDSVVAQRRRIRTARNGGRPTVAQRRRILTWESRRGARGARADAITSGATMAPLMIALRVRAGASASPRRAAPAHAALRRARYPCALARALQPRRAVVATSAPRPLRPCAPAHPGRDRPSREALPAFPIRDSGGVIGCPGRNWRQRRGTKAAVGRPASILRLGRLRARAHGPRGTPQPEGWGGGGLK
jgi:hypothetical protein